MLARIIAYGPWVGVAIFWAWGTLMFLARNDPEAIEKNLEGWRLTAVRVQAWLASKKWGKPTGLIALVLGGIIAGVLLAPFLGQARAPFEAGALQSPPMVKSEVIRLLDELPTLTNFMDRSDPLNHRLAAFLSEQSQLITLKLSPADAAQKANALQQEFQSLRNEFYHFLGDRGYDHDELYKLIDWTEMNRRRGEEFGVIVVDLGNYTNRLGMYTGVTTPEKVIRGGPTS
jgi:hypothetical protein